MSVDQIVEETKRLPEGTKIQVLGPIVRDRKGEYQKLFKDLQSQGYARVRVDGEFGEVDQGWKLEKTYNVSIAASFLLAVPSPTSGWSVPCLRLMRRGAPPGPPPP